MKFKNALCGLIPGLILLGVIASGELSAQSIALIDRPDSGIYGGGQFHNLLNDKCFAHDLFGTHPSAATTQTLYDNILDYDLIILGQNAGMDATINTAVAIGANQQILHDWIFAGGNVFMNVYNDAGHGDNFLNLPGIDFNTHESLSQTSILVNDDVILHAPNEVEADAGSVGHWERFLAFPTLSTNQKIIFTKIGHTTLVSFNFGSGKVIYFSAPIAEAHSQWTGMEQNNPGSGANFLENIVQDLGGTSSCNEPPTADAGADFSVDEGQASVMLDGSGSSDPDEDPLTHAWAQVGGTSVTLSDPAAQQPTFDAPIVALGGETLSFELTVTAAGEDASDTVSVTVVNVNHPPVADAGNDQSVAEGAPATLHGEDSFDIDSDTFSYAWVQVGGDPVTLSDPNAQQPTFTAPIIGGGGDPGVVATLVFELTVDDGFPFDAPAPGYAFEDVLDSVTVEITNVNNDPTADADMDQTVDENSGVTLNGALSSDPDDDTLTYSWAQTGGTSVSLADGSTASPSFTTPFVAAGGEDLTFELTVSDGFGGDATDSMVVHVQNANDPPLVSAAEPSKSALWPPNHGLVAISINGVSDPDNNATITIDSVTQDESTNGQGDGDTPIDAIINADGTVLIRAERSGNGDGRVYHIHFTASDLEGSASGVVTVTVPKKKKDTATDGGELFDSTQ